MKITRSCRLLSTAVLALAAAALASEHAKADTFNVTYEAPGVLNTNAGFSYSGTETFDSLTPGVYASYTTHFGTMPSGPYYFTGVYSNLQVNPADVYGGAGGSNYAVTFTSSGYSLSLSAVNTATSSAVPVNYFGFWLSALDEGNDLTFYSHGAQVFSFDPAQVLALTGNCSNPGNGYCGNPSGPYAGGNSAQPYVFLNFFDTSGSFDQVVFSENPEVGGYESDNHTIGYFVRQSGNSIPVPGALAILVPASLLLVGLARRSR